LQTWVSRSEFPRDHYFGVLESCREQLKARADGDFDQTASNGPLAMMLGGALDDEGALLSHAIEEDTLDFKDELEWAQICIAAGWCLIQLYEREQATQDD
jgi:hypothetical protein